MSTPGGEILRRDDVVSGSIQSQRRAARVMGSIESRILHMRQETRRAIDSYFFGGAADYQRKVDRGYLASVLTRARTEADVDLPDFERFATQWRSLVPADARTRADLIRRMEERFGANLGTAEATLEALGARSPEVVEAYREAFASDLGYPTVARPETAITPDPQDAADWLRVPGGADVYRWNEPAEALYLVVNGHLRLLGGAPGAESVDWEYSRGDVAGEAEVLTGEPRMGRLVAVRDSELIRVPQQAVLALARERPETMLRMNRALVNRLRGRTTTSVRRGAHTFALLPLHDNAPLRAVADGLVEALKPMGATSRIDQGTLNAHLLEGPGLDEEAYEAEVIAWLSEQESAHRYVIAQGERDPRAGWSQRCLRQADQVVLVAEADAEPDATVLALLEGGAPPDLLLVHPSGTVRPGDTRRWLRTVNPRFVYHWRMEDRQQAAHVARRLTGQGVAIVLSGGAARGYAHIGAMRAIEERGIPVDLIAGTSMGALVGAGFALGRDAASMREGAIATAQRRKLLDPTLPISAFTSGRKVTRLLKDETQGERIEDLWRPYFCVSTNLTRAAANVHARGLLWHAIRASSAIPGVFPPILAANGDVLTDGSAINNMPIDLARQRDDIATVLAVNVAPSRDRAQPYRFGASVSGWGTLARRLKRTPETGAPGLFSTVMRANEVRGAALMRSSEFTSLADLIIEPPVEQFPLLQFALCPAIVDCGYDAATASLTTWLSETGDELLRSLGIPEGTK